MNGLYILINFVLKYYIKDWRLYKKNLKMN